MLLIIDSDRPQFFKQFPHTWNVSTLLALMTTGSALRPRTNPGKQKSSGNNNTSSEEISIMSKNEPLKKRRLQGLFKLGLIILLFAGSLIFAFIAGSWKEKQRQSAMIPKTQGPKKMEMIVSWKGESKEINKEGDLDGDACLFLSKCFTSKYFAPDPIKYPQNPLQPCYKTLKMISRSFDNGFYYEGGRLVGFISGHSLDGRGFSAINLYNVCVRPEERGRGLAKSMVPEFVKQMVDKRVPKPNPKVYIGLDVDFDTETAVSAFALYAKMGFNRWWEPCSSINEFDYYMLERQHDLANPSAESAEKRPSVIFPMSQMMLRRRQTFMSQLRDRRGTVYHHFCMVMVLGADDFGTIGKEMKEMVQTALLESKRQ